MEPGTWRGFASDNYSGIHPEVLTAIADVNSGHQAAYGDDDVTASLAVIVQHFFGEQAQVFPVFNGTGANVTALSAMCARWEAVICASGAHIHNDEGGAPEKVGGLKLWTIPTPDGKLTPELIDREAHGFGFVHRAQPRVVSITQSTELGTVYTVDELRHLVSHAHSLGLLVHMDGARLANAAASLGKDFSSFTTDVGIDAVSFGGTKNGAMGAEAVITLRPELAAAIPFVRKSDMQLASKMRFISAQLIALLTDDLWLRNAGHSNAMAQRLSAGVRAIDGIVVTQPTQANAVFAVLPRPVIARLQETFRFYVWDESTGEVRWMCSWDTTEDEVDRFVASIAAEMAR